MQPYDYTIKAPNIVESYNKGVAIGLARDEAELANQAKQQAILQQQAALEAEQRRQQMIAEFQAKPNPTGADYGRLIVADPKNSEAFKRAFETTSQAQRENAFSDASQLFAAVNVGNLEVANQLLDQRIQAAENVGDQRGAQQFDTAKKLLAQSPDMAKLVMASVMHGIDPEKATKVIDSSNKMILAPIEQRKAEAEASTAEVGAKFAEREKLAGLEEKGWNIKNIQSLIQDRKADQAIKAIQVQLSQEGNSLKQQELQLKLDERLAARDEKIAAKVSDFETSKVQIEDSRELLKEIFSDESSLRAVTGTFAFKGAIPGTENRAMAQKIERLQNSLAMGNLDKLKGAISDKDIAFLKSASASLDRYQDEDQFIKELRRIESTLDRAEDSLNRKFGVPKVDRRPAAEKIPGNPAQQSSVRSQADLILSKGK